MNLLDVLERLPDAMALIDRQARIGYVNAAAERLVGKPRAELLGRIAWNVVPAPIGPALQAAFDRVLAGEEVLVLGSLYAQGRCFELVAQLVHGDIVLVGRDITERSQAEALRRQTEQRFQILVDSVKDHAISMLDVEGRFVSWNIGGERVFGYREGELLGKDHGILYPPEDAQRPRHNLDAAVAHGRHEDGGWLVRKDGSRLLADCFFYPVYDQSGQPSGFAVVTRDVTERRRMEERIRNSEERLRLATDAAEIGTWDFLAETGQWMPDARCRTLFGLPPDSERFLTRADAIARIHPADRDRVERAWDAALAGADHSLEYRIIRDGVERWLETHGKRCPIEPGKPVRMLAVCRDVTERHRYDEFRQLLPGILAHDLRTPLSTIRMASEMIVKSTVLPASAIRFAEATLRSTNQMTKMADQLLEFTQARFGGGLPLERAATDLAEVCREMVLAAHVTCPEREVRFGVDGDAHGLWDRTRLVELTTNLVGNAIKHGTPERPIDVAVRGEGDHVVLTVHNSGAPIPPELLPVLFDPFRRGYGARREKSYGLGLYISREIVLAHGGTIDVSSSSDAGTTFTVRLPRGAPAFAAASSHA